MCIFSCYLKLQFIKKKRFILLILLLTFITSVIGQQRGFHFINKEKNYEDLDFQLINNIIVIPVEINKKKLNFILDTGVNKTIVFSSSKADKVSSDIDQKFKLSGLGKGLPIDAIVSKNNTFKIKNLISGNNNVYVVLKDNFDFSSKMGITIHGVIGYDLLKNLILRINFKSKKIRFYKPATFRYKECKKCETFPLTIFQKKPYIAASIVLKQNSKKIPVNMLLDSGGSDAIWLFEHSRKDITTPEVYFTDFLGVGLSGTIYGKRSRLFSFTIGGFLFKNPTVSFLDSISSKKAIQYNERNGSIGNDILKRFKVWIDYPNKKLTLQKNGSFTTGFNYNMSGIEVVYNGKILVEEASRNYAESFGNAPDPNSARNSVSIITNYVYKFKPSFKINEVLNGSPADIAGVLQGDVIMKINRKAVYNYKLEDIIAKFQDEDQKIIRLTVLRGVNILNINFKLKKII